MASQNLGHNLTTEHGLRSYLIKNQDEPDSVQILTGGTANYVYRVLNKDNSTTIFKHAAPYLHSNSSFAFDPARMDYEAAILAAVPSFEDPSTSNVHAVNLQSYDSKNKLLQISDGGHQNLKEAYTNPSLDVQSIASNLATWLATLHTSSRTTAIDIAPQGKTIGPDNNPIAVAIYRHSYNNLHTALSKYGHDIDLAHTINSTFGALLSTENECLCHGDFWPGNVLARSKHDDNTVHTPDLTIVDWEMSRRGTSATDVGQFAAEAFLLDRFRGGRGLRRGFLDAYVKARKGMVGRMVGREWVRRMAVHWAVHVAFWPTRVGWCDEEGTGELVGIGVEVLECAVAGEWDRMRGLCLFADVSEDWEAVFAEG